MQFNRAYLPWHILGCLAFLTLPLLLFPHPPEHSLLLFSRPTIRDIIGNVLMLLFFYFNYYLFIPTLYYPGRYILYGLCVTLGLVSIMLLPSLLTGHFNAGPPGIGPYAGPAAADGMPVRPSGTPFFEEIKHSIFLFASVVLFSLLLAVRERLLQSEKAKHAAELSYLKAQINPHFLFNSLNNIYSLALFKDDAAPQAIIHLSELMRYIMREGAAGKLPLAKEIGYINHYIALQKIRYGNTVSIDYRLQGVPGDKEVEPLILLSFIENAFKHGINPDQDSEIKIYLSITAKGADLYVYNKKVSSVRSDHERGIGLDNTRDRLAMQYPGRHELDVQDEGNTFTVMLSMDLT